MWRVADASPVRRIAVYTKSSRNDLMMSQCVFILLITGSKKLDCF
jgi:hypothetical protein